MDKSGISRRSFLTGAAAISAVLAGAGLTGCAPKVVGVAGGAAGAAGSGNGQTMGFDGTGAMPWLGEAPTISDSDVAETLDADVVVVGLGCAGVPATRAAAEAGAKVIAIEASAQLNSVASDMAILGGETMAKWERGDGFLDKHMVVNMHMEESSHHSSFGIISRYCDESGKALDWFVKGCPDMYIASESYEEVPEANRAHYMYPYFYPMLETYDYTKEDMPCYPTSVGFSSLATAMADNLKRAQEAGAEVRYNTKGVKLITADDGSIAGIYAQDTSAGKYLKINAKSVILATGDYLANEDMMKYFAPACVENGNQILSLDLDAQGNYTNVGDGHKMGVWAGAAVEQWHAPMINHMGGGAGSDGRGVIGNNGFLWLNLHGKRFMNEDVPGQQLENQVELQPQRMAYQFFDSSWPQQLKYFPAAHGIACIYKDEALPDWTPAGLKINVRCPADIEAAVAEGRCLKADTIDELLAKIDGMDVQVAKGVHRALQPVGEGGLRRGLRQEQPAHVRPGEWPVLRCRVRRGAHVGEPGRFGVRQRLPRVQHRARGDLRPVRGRRPAGRPLQRAVPHLAQGPVRWYVHGVRKDRRRERRGGQVGGCHDRREQGCGNRFRR